MRTGREGQTIGRIRAAVEARNLPREFKPSQGNRAIGISWTGSFLPKHRVGNPDGNTELLIRVREGLYRLRQ